MMKSLAFLCVCACLSSFVVHKTEQCLQVGNGNGLPSFQDYPSGYSRITSYNQTIIPSYEFTCCGNITEWGADVDLGDSRSYTIDFQLWRPSPTTTQDGSLGTGYYSLVGNNSFTSISLSNGLVQVTPSAQDRIQFQPGDVLGFYVEDAIPGNGIVVVTQSSFAREVVWHASVAPGDVGGCVSAGSSGNMNTLLRGAPAISIETSTYDCSQIASTPPPCPILIDKSVTMKTSHEMPRPTSVPAVPPTEQETRNSVTTTSETATSASESSTSSDPTSVDTTSSTTVHVNGAQPREGGGVSIVIAAVVMVVLTTAVLVTIVSLIVCVAVSKSRRKTSSVASRNVLLGPNAKMDNPNYDYEDESLEAKGEGDSESIENDKKDEESYQEFSNTVLYHSVGPNSQGVLSDSDLSHYERDPHYHKLDSEAHLSHDPLYAAPSSSQMPINYEIPVQQTIFDAAPGVYVPTDAERTKYKEDKKTVYNKLGFFVEEPIYWTPASTTSGLYSQLSSKKYREIPISQLNILEKLGSGEFGEVCKALWTISGATKELAIKTLRPELPEEEKVRFLQEAAIMGQFSHPNVVKLYGVVTVGEPTMICLELMTNGDLKSHLCSISPDEKNPTELQVKFLRFAKLISAGMSYLSRKAFVHRDLAARNILLDESLNCKIGDFGLARDLVQDTYYISKTKGGKLPIKWMAPEALLFKKYSPASDVWSYGMVLFEIWSLGKKPFSMFSNSAVVRKVNTGYNQPPPPGCPRAIYKLMVDCWHPLHSKRPSFSDISQYLSSSNDLLLAECDSASQLGASLSEADSLYKDLQNVYTLQH